MQLDDLRRMQAEAGAVFAAHSGSAAPAGFGAPAREYRAVRTAAGLLDRTAMGRILLRGEDRAPWLQGLVSNDVRLLAAGRDRLQACLLDATGHVQADLTLVRLPDALLVEMELPWVEHVSRLLDDYLIAEDVTMEDVSASIVCFSVQGPRADEFRTVIASPLAIVEADHTGESGFDLYVAAGQAAGTWCALREAGAEPAGADVAEVLRVEAGIPRYGIDLDASVLPLEAGLLETHISTEKGCYVGQEIVARILSHGRTNRALTGLLLGGAAAQKGDSVLFEGREVGRLTSVVDAMGLDGRIALGFVRHEAREPGTQVTVVGAAGASTAQVAALPFVPRAAGMQP